MSATITELIDERRRCADLVTWYQNRVLRLDIALAECCEGLHRMADQQSPTATPAVAVVDLPERKRTTGITAQIREMFSELNGDEVTWQAIYLRVATVLMPRKIDHSVFGGILSQMCRRGEIRRVGRGVYANVRHDEMEIRRVESVARGRMVPDLAETLV